MYLLRKSASSVCRVDHGRSSLSYVFIHGFDLYSQIQHRQKHSRSIHPYLPDRFRHSSLLSFSDLSVPTLPDTDTAMAADLTRATLVRNPDYERNGLKSYVRALQKYRITPTVNGPYCHASKPESDVQGVFTDHAGKILTREFQLVKRDAETARAGTVPVCLSGLERSDWC